jgi:hypothetical protein
LRPKVLSNKTLSFIASNNHRKNNYLKTSLIARFKSITVGERANMMCSHISCAKSKTVWLSLVTHMGFIAHTKKHPYCEKCGTVKNIGYEKARSIGFYTGVLTSIREYVNKRQRIMPKFTQTQVRLIAKELESSDLFFDTYGANFDIQKHKFIEKVRKHRPDLTEKFINGFM